MENSHYFLRTLGLESYMSQDPLSRVDMDNFELDSKIKTLEHTKSNDSIKDICGKQDVISEEVRQITADIEADDFFSSLELLSSSKMSSNMLGLGFSNKLTSGIVTRSQSRFFSNSFQEMLKAPGKIVSRFKTKTSSKKDNQKKKGEKLSSKKKKKSKKKSRKPEGSKKSTSEEKDKTSMLEDSKKQNSNRLDENNLEKSLELEKSKDEDDWILFNNLGSRNEVDDKMFENKQILPNDLPKPAKKSMSELCPINSISASDGVLEEKDEETDNSLEVEDYEDNFLKEMDEFNYAPPRSHTGGKWKPGTVRTSPMLWHSQNWDNFLDDKFQDEEKRNRADTPADSPTDLVASTGKSKSFDPPTTHTGGKWKPTTPPATYTGSKLKPDTPPAVQIENKSKPVTGGKRKPATPPVTHTKGKRKPFTHSKGKRKPVTPPVAHTGGKGKPATPPVTHTGGKWKPVTPSVTHTGGKMNPVTHASDKLKPATPPVTHTGGKWKPVTPPVTHTGGKWKPPDRPKKLDQDLISLVENDQNWKYESEGGMEPPPTYTGGKWKPSASHANELWKTDTGSKSEMEAPSLDHALEKSESETDKSVVPRSTLDRLANCQSTSGKCLKTSGGMIEYYCFPCNRRLSSKKLYKKHIMSELHFKRFLQENELEFDSRSIKIFHGFLTQSSQRERSLGKRIVKQPESLKNTETDNFKKKKIPPLIRINGRRIIKRELIFCEVCEVKLPSNQVGKHLVSYYHSRRVRLNDPNQRKLVLDYIHAIVKLSPYQCGICKFYCNTHNIFKKHWALSVHKKLELLKNHRFWCSLCGFECDTSLSMGLHLDSNSHRDVILAVNKSIPIIIRHKLIINCDICSKEFRFYRGLERHKKISHEVVEKVKTSEFVCSVCEQDCKNVKSLQRHIIKSHKGATKVPYYCSICNEFFNTADESRNHRNSPPHKRKKRIAKGIDPRKLSKSCSYCNITLENLPQLKAHLLEKHYEFLPKCIKCGKVFALSQEVSRHSKKNECDFSKKRSQFSHSEFFKCDKCPFSTTTKSEYLLHLVIHNKKSKNGKKISCPLCRARFTQSSLRIHLRTHLKEKTFHCSVCSKTFVRKDRLVKHIKSKHKTKENIETPNVPTTKTKEINIEKKENNTDETEKTERKDKAKTVQSTSESVPAEEDLVKKKKLCGDKKCRFVPKNPEDLETHTKFHVGPKVYQCTECPYKAKTYTIIKRHFMIHADERSFPCELCSFKARLKSHLKRHIRLHTGSKPYRCPHCPYTCNILENLRKHVLCTKIHPGKNLYECKLCPFSTNVSKEFKTHLLKNHKDAYRATEVNELAGIYCKDADYKNDFVIWVTSKRKTPPKETTKKVYPAAVKKKKELLLQKFSPIAPKPPTTNEATNTSENNEVSLELEEPRNESQLVKKKLPRSYPSPAEKDENTKRRKIDDVTEENRSSKVSVMTQTNELGEIDFFDLIEIPVEEPFLRVTKNGSELQQMYSVGILSENELPSNGMEFYLESYQV